MPPRVSLCPLRMSLSVGDSVPDHEDRTSSLPTPPAHPPASESTGKTGDHRRRGNDLPKWDPPLVSGPERQSRGTESSTETPAHRTRTPGTVSETKETLHASYQRRRVVSPLHCPDRAPSPKQVRQRRGPEGTDVVTVSSTLPQVRGPLMRYDYRR